MRIALYARVSTDEQAKHGLSIDTQLANLREWAKKNGHTVVGEYVDPGISGKKPPSKRPDLSRFFADLERGLSVDALVFTKLDRFFRSVKLYYQAVEVLDRHKVGWLAIQEDYETVTASGRMKVNIMLAVAENEADRTAERIKVVFDRKVEMGEVINPSGLPRGFAVEGKRVVHNDEAPAMAAAFEHYARFGSIHATMDYLRQEYGISMLYKSLSTALKNPLYAGRYRENPNYCEPIVSKELFAEVQHGLQSRSVRKNQTHREYIFSGMIVCAECGRTMIGLETQKNYKSYRCQQATLNHACINHYHIGERKLERDLLTKIEAELGEWEAQFAPKKKPTKKTDPAKIQAKLDRLKDLYVDGLISKEQYLADRKKLDQKPPEPPQTDFSTVRQVITAKDFRSRYEAFSPSERRALWRSIIDHIEVDANRTVRLFFRD